MLLIVHTRNLSRRPHLQTARSYVPRIALLQDRPTWERTFADEILDVDTCNLSDCVSAAQALHRREPVEAVVTFVEHSVLTAAVLADSIGVRGIGPETALLARDKYQMRLAMSAAGVPCPRFSLATTLADALQIGTSFGYPLVLKPVIGGGSQFVRRVDNPGELATHFHTIKRGSWQTYEYDPLCEPARYAYRDAVLIESYVAGGEVSVESVVVNGHTIVLAIHDKPLPMIGPCFDEIYYATPSRLPLRVIRRIGELTARVHESVGIHDGPSHSEFRIAGDEPVALEVGARIGGGGIYTSVLNSVGVDMVKAAIDLAHGRRPQLRPQQARPTGLLALFAGEEGILEEVAGLAEATADPHVVDISIYHRAGDPIVLPPRAFQSHGHVVATADTPDELDEVIAGLQRSITFRVRPALLPASQRG